MAKKLAAVPPFDPEEDLLPEGPDDGGQEAAELEAATRGVLVAEIGDDHAEEAQAAVEEATANGVDWTDVKAALESGYESRNPNFTAGGTAYVRVFCPECDQPMFFSVETDTQLTIKGDERKLKPTFKVTAKVHTCHQTVASESAFLEDEAAVGVGAGDGGVAADAVSEVERDGLCPCPDCDPACDNEAGVSDGADGPVPSVCVPCANGDHVDEEDDDGDD